MAESADKATAAPPSNSQPAMTEDDSDPDFDDLDGISSISSRDYLTDHLRCS